MKSASKHSKENAGGPAGRVGCRGQLAGLGWLIYCAAFAWLGLGLNRLAVDAAPVPGPDLSTCGPPNLPNGVQPTDCCPPYTSTVVDFKLPSPTEQLRVRPAAHLVDADYLAMYKKAVELMKALPTTTRAASSSRPTCTAPTATAHPSIYTDTSSPLYDNLRNANYQPPALLSLDFSGTKPPAQQIQNNLQVMKREMITGGTTAQLFLGAAYRAGDQPDPAQAL
uniref:Uncharacterized protein n=1 Tax=Ananas comosus var. bracteatus TaxID=296719 RepID=A0A6V7QX29_ANACO